jgi:hypothetical protein
VSEGTTAPLLLFANAQGHAVKNMRKETVRRAVPVIAILIVVSCGRLFTELDSVSSPQRSATASTSLAKQSLTSYSARWERSMEEAERMLLQSATNGDLPACLLPDTKGTAGLVERAVQRNQTFASLPYRMPLPVLNMGMPKTGSSTLAAFFKCVGMHGTHQVIVNNRKEIEFEGICMRDAVNLGLPPIQTCSNNSQYMMQLDVDFPFGFAPKRKYKNGPYVSDQRDECYFPQLSLLEEFHQEAPNATFVMNFRPIHDWVKSMAGWGHPPMMKRFPLCQLPNKPRGVPGNINNESEVINAMEHFICSHVLHLRQFVEDHPSHALIELDLYDADTSTSVMTALFPTVTNQSCWQHTNKSKQLKGQKNNTSEQRE